jgi:hypothetical protein
MAKELVPHIDLQTILVDAAPLRELSDEGLAETFIRAERLAMSSYLCACACVDEFRRRYARHGEAWYNTVGEKLGRRPATIWLYSRIWRVYQEILRGGSPSEIETFRSLSGKMLNEIGKVAHGSRLEAARFVLALVARQGEPSARALERAFRQKGFVPAPRRARREFGPPLNFRELRHEPVNEQGVVLLFGMVAREMGFLVESVQGGFPDCTAKRRRGKGGHYVRADIEFEFKSSNFREHGHDAEQCDLIVCWEDDWGSDCPVEVLELKSKIKELDANA